VAQVYAGLHPDRVTHMISEDVGPERPRQIADNYQRRVSEDQPDGRLKRRLLRKSGKRIPVCPTR
jgi:hypothetical protein